MTTTLQRPPAPGGAPHEPARERHTSRLATWRTSWRVALRMARRETRRHKGRSLLVLVMVGVPVALLTFALSTLATTTLDDVETIPTTMGDDQALVTYQGPQVVRQPSPTRS